MSVLEINVEHLFVYGSLKRSYKHEMHRHLVNYAQFVDAGQFQGKLYRIAWYPGVIESDKSSDKVMGEIYRITQPSKLLPLLDEFEGYDTANLPASEYLRKKRPIIASSGDVFECYIYLYHAPLGDSALIASGVF